MNHTASAGQHDPQAFMVTACAQELHLTSPALGHIVAAGIGHSLAQINRFTGHASRPYSVAEHSLLVVEILEREHGITPATLDGCNCLLAGLLHDAHEAYTNDLSSPAKAAVGPAWRQFESHLERVVQTAFAVRTAMHRHGERIKQADLQALATEKRDLLPATPTPWASLQGIDPITWLQLNSPERLAMGWTDWRDAWLTRLDELDFARNALAGLKGSPA
jgi:hypothetical protein